MATVAQTSQLLHHDALRVLNRKDVVDSAVVQARVYSACLRRYDML